MFNLITKPIITVSIMLLFFNYPNIINAEGGTKKLSPIKVFATRSTATQNSPTSSITVISRDKILQSQHQQLEDILRETPGLNVVQTGPMGSQSNVFMRGTGSGATLVMMDGIQINGNTTGLFDFRDFILDNVERIEILRGPQSNLWGADAVGGVINIITRQGKGKPLQFVSFEAGSFNTFKETVGSSGDLEIMDYSFTASRTDTDGFSAASEEDGNNENDGYEATNFSTRLGYDFINDGRVEFIGRLTKSISDFDGFSYSTGRPVDSKNYNKIHTYYMAIPIQKKLTTWLDTKLSINMSYDDFKSIDSSFGESNVINRTYTADFQNNLKFNEYLSAVAGFEYQILNGTNVENDLHKNIYQSGYFMQGTVNYENKAIFTAGVRHDVNSRFKNKTTYKIEGSYLFTKTGTTIRTSNSTGFRGPTLNDLFYPGFSNPDLQPEESENWEVGISQTLWGERIKIGLTYFNTEFDNLIQFDSTTWTPQNILKADSQGIESFLNFDLNSNITLNLNHTWNQATEDEGAPLRRRPKNVVNVGIQSIIGKWNSALGLHHRSGIRDGTFNTKSFVTIRATLSYEVNKNLTLKARGENLLDKNYEEIPGYTTAGASGFVGFIYKY